ncbi:MAG: type II secretion system F family protein [Proteobacteria bacterium]|nr:type II secretion system F family protein [Pseudomonadota bacterium]MBU4288670.1 type II secretion system F family protein [Pseudomonadota bacterium]MCG2758881.1 type II secretion system F family protein [Desulfobacteraceae bacterium]
MPTYAYKAIAADGSSVSGTVEADSQPLAATQLDKMEYIPISISEKKGMFLDELALKLERVKIDDLIFFTRQLYTIIKAGIPLLAGLRALEQQTENKKLKKVLGIVAKDVDRGKSFSESLSLHPDVFSELYINMIEAGEVGGSLEEILERLILMIEFSRKTASNLKAAVRYPIMVICSLCAAFGVVITFVIPKFAVIFEASTVELPIPTKIMMFINFLVQNYWYYGALIIGSLVAAFFLYKRHESGRLQLDYLKLKIPILGDVFLKVYMSRFSSMLETLSRSGTSIVTALEVVSRTIGNEYIAHKIRDISEQVKIGKGITNSLRESKIFPPLVLHMVLTGEETGALDDMLAEITSYYEREIDYTVSRMSSYIEPILTVGLGLMVLFIALAIFLPWWNMMEAFKG